MAVKIDVPFGTKRCWDCKMNKSVVGFWKNKSKPDGLANECKFCCSVRAVAWRRRPENVETSRRWVREANHRTRYGTDVVEWTEKQFVKQNRVCAICLDDFGEAGPSIDHDHACCPGKVACGKCRRGLLCRKCNSALGFLDDDLARPQRAIAYLKGRD